jgi:hypothetical protein
MSAVVTGAVQGFILSAASNYSVLVRQCQSDWQFACYGPVELHALKLVTARCRPFWIAANNSAAQQGICRRPDQDNRRHVSVARPNSQKPDHPDEHEKSDHLPWSGSRPTWFRLHDWPEQPRPALLKRCPERLRTEPVSLLSSYDGAHQRLPGNCQPRRPMKPTDADDQRTQQGGKLIGCRSQKTSIYGERGRPRLCASLANTIRAGSGSSGVCKGCRLC